MGSAARKSKDDHGRASAVWRMRALRQALAAAEAVVPRYPLAPVAEEPATPVVAEPEGAAPVERPSRVRLKAR